jgi:hypothetical protein
MIYELYKKFPDVHPNIILKAELNRLGQNFSKEAIEAFKQRDDILWKGYHFFSYDMQKPIFYGDKIPASFHFNDGPSVYTRTNADSPYVIDYREGKFVVTEQGEAIADKVFFALKPKHYDMTTEDGTPMPAIVNAFEDLLFCTFNKYCEFWNRHNECLFCDINAQFREQGKSVEEVVARKDPSIITEVFRTIRTLEKRFWMTMISGGTILGKYRGETEIDFYVRRLNAIREGLAGIWIPACCQVAAHDDEGWKRLYDTGVPSIQPNIEVWGKEMFEWMCPGKAKHIGWDEWIKRTIRAVDFWGVGKVNPNFVIGVEMAKPNGFKDVKSGVDNLREGWDFLMQNGVVPRYAYWTIEPKSALGKVPGQQYPPLEYYIEVEKAYAELRWKHGHELPFPAALGRTSYILSCMQEFEYYHGSGSLSKKRQEEIGGPQEICKVGDGGFVA